MHRNGVNAGRGMNREIKVSDKYSASSGNASSFRRLNSNGHGKERAPGENVISRAPRFLPRPLRRSERVDGAKGAKYLFLVPSNRLIFRALFEWTE